MNTFVYRARELKPSMWIKWKEAALADLPEDCKLIAVVGFHVWTDIVVELAFGALFESATQDQIIDGRYGDVDDVIVIGSGHGTGDVMDPCTAYFGVLDPTDDGTSFVIGAVQAKEVARNAVLKIRRQQAPYRISPTEETLQEWVTVLEEGVKLPTIDCLRLIGALRSAREEYDDEIKKHEPQEAGDIQPSPN